MALFKTARFFFTLDLDFRDEGDDDGEIETLIILLEIKRRHPFHKISPLSFIGIQVVFTATFVRQKVELPGYVCYGIKSGFATLLVCRQFCTIKRSWKFEERCTAILFGTTLVMAVCAPDSSKSMEMHEAFISSVLKVPRDGHPGGAKDCRQNTCFYARMRTFFSCAVHASLMFGSRARRLKCFCAKVISSLCHVSVGCPCQSCPSDLSGQSDSRHKDFYIARDLNVEVGMLCTDEKDIKELNEMYGPLCWQGYDKDPGGFKKLMWYGIVKEFNSKATSTWSQCGRATENGLHAQTFEPTKGRGEIAFRLFHWPKENR